MHFLKDNRVTPVLWSVLTGILVNRRCLHAVNRLLKSPVFFCKPVRFFETGFILQLLI